MIMKNGDKMEKFTDEDSNCLKNSRQQEIKILAVDSDDKLISIAQDKLLKDEQATSSKLDIQFITLDVMDAGNAGVVFEEYLQISKRYI